MFSPQQVKSGAGGLMYNIMGKLVTESIAHVEKCQVSNRFVRLYDEKKVVRPRFTLLIYGQPFLEMFHW